MGVGLWALQGIAATLAMVFAISPSLFPPFYSYVAALQPRSFIWCSDQIGGFKIYAGLANTA